MLRYPTQGATDSDKPVIPHFSSALCYSHRSRADVFDIFSVDQSMCGRAVSRSADSPFIVGAGSNRRPGFSFREIVGLSALSAEIGDSNNDWKTIVSKPMS